MVSNWVTYVWAYVTGYTKWPDAWSFFLSGILAAGITLPVDGQPNRIWAFATIGILFNVAINAIRRAKPAIVASLVKSGEPNMDPITTFVTAVEAAVAAFKATAAVPVQVTTFPETTVVSPNQNITFPVVSPNQIMGAGTPFARAAVAADVVADATETAALAALTPAEAAVVAANTVPTV